MSYLYNYINFLLLTSVIPKYERCEAITNCKHQTNKTKKKLKIVVYIKKTTTKNTKKNIFKLIYMNISNLIA